MFAFAKKTIDDGLPLSIGIRGPSLRAPASEPQPPSPSLRFALLCWRNASIRAITATGPSAVSRVTAKRSAAYCCIHGVSSKVLSMAFANLLLGADPSRERWVTTGASMVAVDTLVHNWLHRTGSLRRLGAEHAYGPACYRLGGCASIIEETARRIDARQFCPDGPAFFPASCRRRSGCSAPRLTLGFATATASTTATAARKRLAHSLYPANACRFGGNWQRFDQDDLWLVRRL